MSRLAGMSMSSLISWQSTVDKIFYAVLILCSALIITVVWLLKDAHESYQLARMGYAQQVQAAFQTIENHEWLTEHSQRFVSLTENGTVGVPDELVWMDFLAPLYRAVSIEDYQFEISPFSSHSAEKDLTVETADVSLYGNVLHDGVLADLLGVINENAPGGWYYQSLEVVRNHVDDSAATGEDVSQSSLAFVLSLTWVVVSTPGTDGVGV